MLFKGKIALITGAGTGIGRSTAVAFSKAGARGIVLAGRRRSELEATGDLVSRAGATPLVVPTDVSVERDLETLVRQAIAKFGAIDAAFNNAGIEGAFAPITDLTGDQFDATIAINLKGVWLSCKQAITAMKSQGRGGAIVNTSSWLAYGAFPGSSIYSASKAALDGMIRALALEVAADDIRVNNVNPGIIDTPMFRRFADDAAAQPFIQHTPTRRLGTPEDVAETVVWLCSDHARFITGQTILIDGGYAIPGHRVWLSGAVAPDGSR
jgi:NAD(P)-dependent dehydrogenase (short-subunit alcohol dehydrogenase family)